METGEGVKKDASLHPILLDENICRMYNNLDSHNTVTTQAQVNILCCTNNGSIEE